MQFNKDEWTTHVVAKISEKYGKLSKDDKRDIETFLHTDWCQSASRLLTIAATLLGYGVGGATLIPLASLNIQFIKALGLSAGYIATQIGIGLATTNLTRVPAYDVITDHQLEALFKKADDIKSFIQVLRKLERIHSKVRTESENSMMVMMPGILVGSLVSSQIAPSTMLISAIGVSRSLPKLFFKEYSILTGVVNASFEDKLEEATAPPSSPP